MFTMILFRKLKEIIETRKTQQLVSFKQKWRINGYKFNARVLQVIHLLFPYLTLNGKYFYIVKL